MRIRHFVLVSLGLAIAACSSQSPSASTPVTTTASTDVSIDATLPTDETSYAPIVYPSTAVTSTATPQPVLTPDVVESSPGVPASTTVTSTTTGSTVVDLTAPTSGGRGFPTAGPWLVYYGTAAALGDLTVAAATYRIFVIQAGAFNATQIATLQASGRNRVLAYLDVGSVEHSADWWTTVPSGFTPASQITAAQIGPYGGYSDETWMNPNNPDWSHLLLGDIAPTQLADGADGLMLDNMELVTHGAGAADGPCDATCAAAGLELVYQLRQAYPNKLIVMNNATGDVTRLATVHGVQFSTLLDGVLHEDVFTQATSTSSATDAVYSLQTDAVAVSELKSWQALQLNPGGHPFWVGTLDFVNACSNTADAKTVAALSRADGFSPAISDKSAGLSVLCAAP